MSKLKAFANDKLNVAKMTISVFDGVESTVGKGENAGYQHFVLFPTVFFKDVFFRVVSRDLVVKSYISLFRGKVQILVPKCVILFMNFLLLNMYCTVFINVM